MNNNYFLALMGLFLILLTIDLSAQVQLDVAGEAIITSSSSEPTLTIQNDTKADLVLKRGAATGSLQLNAGGGALGLTGNNGGDNIIQLRTYGTSYFNGGKFGIGTISPDETFHVHKGSAGAIAASPGAIGVFENDDFGYINLLTPDGKANGILFGQPTLGRNAGGIFFDANFVDGLEFRTGGNMEHLIGITADGKMGIGTAAPAEKLQVVGANDVVRIRVENTSDLNATLRAKTPASDYGWYADGDENIFKLFDFNAGIGGEDRMSILGNGNVGIGTTTPSEKLHVIGSVEATSFIGDGSQLTGISGGSSLWTESGNDIYRNTGNVGIGTLPEEFYKFAVGSNMILKNDGGVFFNDNTAANAQGYIKPVGNNLIINATKQNNGIVFSSANTARMCINSAGNVGIGTTPSSHKLDVNGNIKAHSFIGDCASIGVHASIGTALSSNVSLKIENLNEDNFGIDIINNDTFDGNGDLFPTVRIQNVGAGGAALFIAGGSVHKPGGGLWSTTSDIRTKKDIVNYEEGLAELKKIRTVWYTYNGKGQTPEGQKFVGIIAQELQKIAPHMIVLGQDGYLAVDPSAFTYMLINAVQELNNKVDKEKAENEALTAKVNHLESQISTIQNLDALLAKANALEAKLAAFEQLEQKIKTLEDDVNFCCQSQGNLDVKAESRTAITLEETAHLEQNTPNPFNGETTIQYYLPKWAYDAQLQITDFNGKVLKVENNLTTGHGTISLAADALPSGTYSYSLLVDGKIVDTKRMVLVK